MANATDKLKSFEALIGTVEGPGEWKQIKQEQINLFADATGDHQFIHVDPEKAAKESPFGVTIAHGYMTVALIPLLLASVPQNESGYEGVVAMVNYGLDKVRFPLPVKVDSKVRATRELVRASLKSDNGILLAHKVTIEIEGESKPACIAETLVLAVFA